VRLTRDTVRIPPALRANWADWRLGDIDALVADVLSRCAAAVHAWDLGSLQPLPGGEVALVLAAHTPGGEAVLKLSPRPLDAPRSLEGAAPRVLGTRDAGSTLLLERIRPGDTLRETGAGAREIVEAVGMLCPRLHLPAEQVAGAGFPTLADHAQQDGWFSALSGPREHDELVRLTRPEAGDRLLHVDLHWLNVLEGPHGRMAIDPKPCVGDPCADVWVFFDGPPRREIPGRSRAAREYLRGLIDLYAGASGLDPARLPAWIRIRATVTLSQSDPSATRERGLSLLAEAASDQR
jgi:streptomycin 6-kinase